MPTPQSPQLLDPHKYEDKSGVPSTGSDAELRKVVVDMLKQGHSDEEVRQFIHKVDVAHMSVAGQMGQAFADHIVPALLTGITGVPMMVKDAVIDGLSVIQGRDPEHAKAFIDSLTELPEKWKNGTPYERAAIATDLGGSMAAGGAESGGVFAARKPLARAVGATLSEAATHPGAVRLASGGAMLHGFYNGSPTEMGLGAAGAALPDAVGSVGAKLYKYGADGAKYITKKERAAAQAATDAQLPSGARSLDTGPVNSLSLAPPTSGPQGTSRVPQVGMPATANSRVQRVMADEAKSESAVAGRQAARASGTNAIPVPQGLSASEEAAFREIKASNAQIPDSVIVKSIRGTNAAPIANAAPAGRPAIRVTGSPSAAAVMEPPVVERRLRTGQAPDGAERRLAATADDLPPTGSVAERAAALRKENPYIDADAAAMAKASAARVPENYMTGNDVANIGEQASSMGDKTLKTLETAGLDVPEDGLRASQDIDRVAPSGPLNETAAFKDLQESIRQSKKPVPTPPNLHMGSDASPKDMMADVRVRAQGGGGIRIDGSRPGRPISLVKGEPLPLPEEAAAVLKSYLADNPDIDPAVAEQHVRDFMAKMGTDE